LYKIVVKPHRSHDEFEHIRKRKTLVVILVQVILAPSLSKLITIKPMFFMISILRRMLLWTSQVGMGRAKPLLGVVNVVVVLFNLVSVLLMFSVRSGRIYISPP